MEWNPRPNVGVRPDGSRARAAQFGDRFVVAHLAQRSATLYGVSPNFICIDGQRLGRQLVGALESPLGSLERPRAAAPRTRISQHR